MTYLWIALGIVGFFLLVFLLLRLRRRMKRRVHKGTVLELDLRQGISEQAQSSPLARVTNPRASLLRDLVFGLDRASRDKRVDSLVVEMGSSIGLGMAQMQELRDAVLRFRASGKKAYFYAESIGSEASGLAAWYFASAFDEIWVLPVGDFALTGLMSEAYFLAEVFERVGVEPNLDHREEYKTAKNLYTEKEMTPAQREMTESILRSLEEQMISAIAERRGLSVDEVRQLVQDGPFLVKKALESKWIDHLAYRDELYAKVRKGKKEDEERPLLYLGRYAHKTKKATKGKRVGLIYGTGPIMPGPSKPRFPSGEMTFGALDVARAFRSAIEDEDLEGIIFRVDSPGGSAIASDVVWNEVRRARAAGKKVVVSMGNVAGSGGYYVAAPADRILAQPGTLTGSIGVVGGKVVLRKLWDKVGLKWDQVVTSPNALHYSTRHPFAGASAEYSREHMDQIYENFRAKVAEGRRMSSEAVHAVAKGRVWTGAQALENGLVDEMGGLFEAYQAMKKLLEVPEEKSIRVELFPRSKGMLTRYLDPHPENSERALVEWVPEVPSVRALAQEANLVSAPISIRL